MDGKDNRGWRPIHEAANEDFTDCLSFLLEQGELVFVVGVKRLIFHNYAP